MKHISLYLAAAVLTGIAPADALAHSYGPPPRVTGGTGDNARACTSCHAGGALNSGTGSVNIVLQGGAFYIPGVKQRITVQVADPTQQRWGFELSARLNSDLEKGQAGDFNPVDNMTQVICEDASSKPCLTGVTFITHTAVGTRNGQKNGATFQFDWMPPSTNAGPVTLYVAGNAANGNNSSTGDLIYTSSIQLTPVAASAPSVSGSIVSAATSAAGPVNANHWVTVFGTNLSATTRAWTAGDFTDGTIPFSLDGVSVLLTQGGVPRLAFVGYVSPTQVNFLMPSDLNTNAAPTVQVKNPAGITAGIPLTVGPNAPQLFTSDGKAALGTHINGSLVSKDAPAAPGETITIYGTGMGATSPALITGQVPTDATPLATLPQVTIGGLPATVNFGGVVPGTAGVYQLNVQVPSGAANGDLPLLVQAGASASASTTLAVQK